MSNLRPLLSQIGTYGAWSMLSKSIGFILLPFYTNFLSPADYGILAMLDLIATYFGIMVNAGFSSAMLRFYNKHRNPRWQKRVFTSCLLGIFLVGCVVAFMALVLIQIFDHFLDFKNVAFELVTIILITTFICSLNSIVFTLLRIQERLTQYVIINAINLVISVTLNIVLIAVFELGVYGFVISGLISAVFTLFIGMVFVAAKFYAKPLWSLMVKLFNYSYPFVFSGLMSAFIHNTAIICMTFTMSIDENLTNVGIYAVGQKIGSIVSVVGSSIVMAWTPYMFKHAKENDAPKVYAKGLLGIISIMLSITLVLTVFSGPLVQLMTENSFHSAAMVILPVGVGLSIFILTPTLRMGINLHDKTKLVPFICLVAIALGFPLTFYVTKIFGIYGAAWGQAITWIIYALLIVKFSDRYLHVPYDVKKIAMLIVAFASSIVFYLLLPNSIYFSVLPLITFPVLLIISGVFRHELSILLNFIKR